MKLFFFLILLTLISCPYTNAQVDTTFIYNSSTPYGLLDIRIAKSATRYYYLQENKTFSFRESAPGVKTNTYRDMTSWDSSPYQQGNLREKNGSSDAFVMNYRLLFPGGYQSGYSQGYPLIVMAHGVGETANCWDSRCLWADGSWRPSSNNPPAPTSSNHELLNNDRNMVHGGKPHLDARNLAGTKLPDDPSLSTRAFQGFVLFPQNLNGWDTQSMQDLIRLVRLAIKKYNIDPNRVYIHGLSNGGMGTYGIIKRAPWLFAAALPMSAPGDGGIFGANLQATIANIPMWTFQGGIDTAPKPATTEGYVRKFRDAGADILYTIYPNLGHGTWNTAYSEPEFFSWIRSKNKTQLHVFFNNPVICGPTGQGVKLGFAAGFLAYQWEKDGQIIAGVKGPEYVATQPGAYRARFSRLSKTPTEAQWEKWSQVVTVTRSNPAAAGIIPLTTTLLRGPDNAAQNTIQLKAATKNDKYYWYKNGTLINIPNNSADDTVRNYTITGTSTGNNGAYKLITKSLANCASPESQPVNLFFNNSAPLLADSNTPASFRLVSATATVANLAWQDRSTVETAYEIWRRPAGGTFLFAGRTAANAQSFSDKGLAPSTTYDYKIRTVNNQGRSKYAPSDNLSTNLTVTTLGDSVAPTAPKNLKMVRNTINSITLSWTASTDNNGVIKQYVVYYGTQSKATNSSDPSYTITGLPMNQNYNITVKAVDNANLYSPASNQITGTTTVTGLWYGHSTGAWTDLDQITVWDQPEFTGWVPNFTLAPRTQDEYFNFEFTGYLFIHSGGTYYFYLNSDDGSRIYIDGKQVLDFDGLHGKTSANGGFGVKSAAVTLTSGPHDLRVLFFEYTSGQALTVAYQGVDTDNLSKYIPDEALTSGEGDSGGSPMTVDIISPEANSQFTESESITLKVAATASEGSIEKVEFYNGGTRLGEDTTSPYAYTWSNVPQGNFTVIAKAIDDSGTVDTDSVEILVTNGTTCTATGSILRELWTGIQYNDVASIPVNTPPDAAGELTIFEDPSNFGDNFGTRVSGYLCIPESGAYTFWISSNDHSELWLSTDAEPGNKRKIAYIVGASNPRQWDKFASQRSAPINLVAGQRYYIEALHKEGVNSDHMAVGWQLPDGTFERPIPGNRLSPYVPQENMMAFEATTFSSMTADSLATGANDAEINIFPNPAVSGFAELTLSGYEQMEQGSEAKVEIVRMTGEVIYSKKHYCETNCAEDVISINQELTPGIYLINVITNGNRVSKRLLVK